jgi:hypothetical protein
MLRPRQKINAHSENTINDENYGPLQDYGAACLGMELALATKVDTLHLFRSVHQILICTRAVSRFAQSPVLLRHALTLAGRCISRDVGHSDLGIKIPHFNEAGRIALSESIGAEISSPYSWSLKAQVREEQGADNDTAIFWCRRTDAGSANVERSHRSNAGRSSAFVRASVVELLPATQSLHGLGWLSVAEHVLALSNLCPSGMGAL